MEEKVRCVQYRNCPNTRCPHYEEHEPYWGLTYIGFSRGERPTCYCDERTCGLREPLKKVKCLPVPAVAEKCPAAVKSGYPEPVPA